MTSSIAIKEICFSLLMELGGEALFFSIYVSRFLRSAQLNLLQPTAVGSCSEVVKGEVSNLGGLP